MGRRISRRLYCSHNGILIHADLIAAYNIMRKAIPDAFADRILDAGLHPVGSSINDMANPLNVEESPNN